MTTTCTPLYEILSNLENDGHLERDLIISVYGIICVVGLTANAVLLISLLTGGRKGATFKTPSTILILSLAIADTLFLLTLPFAIDQRIRNYWIFGNTTCKLEEGIKFLNYYASVFFITAMSVERYFSICRPSAFDRNKTRERLFFISVGIWTLALIAVTPILLFSEVTDFGFCTIKFPGYEDVFDSIFIKHIERPSNKTYRCIEDYIYSENLDYYYYDGNDNKDFEQSSHITITPQDSNTKNSLVDCAHPPVKSLHIWLVSNFVIGFVIPFLIITVSYTKIFLFKKKIFYQSGTSTNNQQNETLTAIERTSIRRTGGDHNHRAKFVLGVLVPCLILAFSICWLPYHAWHLAQISGVSGITRTKCSIIQDITICLAFFNSALNPILNSIFLLNFKKRIMTSTLKLRKVFSRKYECPPKLHKNKIDARISEDKAELDPHYEMTVMTTY